MNIETAIIIDSDFSEFDFIDNPENLMLECEIKVCGDSADDLSNFEITEIWNEEFAIDVSLLTKNQKDSILDRYIDLIENELSEYGDGNTIRSMVL